MGDTLIHGIEYTVIGMGTVFAVLIFISFCIMLMGKTVRKMDAFTEARLAAKAEKNAEAIEAPEEAAEASETAPEDSGLSPEIVVAIMAALQMKFDEEIGVGGYRLRNIRRAEWRHM